MARAWIDGDETAKEMLARLLTERPFLFLPPLQRVPLRVGNVVEIVGASPSAKTEVLIQAAINCILPREWNGVHYGATTNIHVKPGGSGYNYDNAMAFRNGSDDELFISCMRRFLYIRCYNSFEFLAALKTMCYHIQKESKAQGVGIHLLMIDSINAFYWVDRAYKPLESGGACRSSLSLQSVIETVIQEIHKLLQLHAAVVLVTKADIFVAVPVSSEPKRTLLMQSQQDNLDSRASNSTQENHLYRDYMPSVWQSFVTQRIFLHASDETFVDSEGKSLRIFSLKWVLPSLDFVDKFVVSDAGMRMIT